MSQAAANSSSRGRAPSAKPRLRNKPAGEKIDPGLYIVATPIGHSQDLTLRARDLLSRVDTVICEDTRVTAKLLAMHGLRAPLLAYHEHNAERVRPVLLERLARGEALALVSDAGTPLVSDPGFKLVREAIAANLPVTALPGASAPLAALVLSGLPSDRFLFTGFLPTKEAARRAALAELGPVPASLIWFETGPRLARSLADARDILGDRPAAVARELTKLHEEVRRGTLGELAAFYGTAAAPKGEIAVVVGPPAPKPAPAENELDERLRDALSRASLSEAVARIAAVTGLPRRQVYARALALKGGDK